MLSPTASGGANLAKERPVSGPVRTIRVRTALIALVASVLLPGLLFAVHEYRSLHAGLQSRAETEARHLAREVASMIERDLSIRVAQLTTLASSPSLASGDFRAFYDQARAAIKPDEGWIIVTDAQAAQLLNTRFDFGAELPVAADAPQLRSVASTGERRISDLFVGAAHGRPLVSVSLPAAGDRVVSWRFEPAYLTALLRTAVAQDWTIAVLDRAGTVVSRTEAPDAFVGRQASPEFWALTQSAPAGWKPTVSLDNLPVYTAWQRLASGWTAVAFIPQSIANAPLQAALDRLMWTLAGLAALTLALSSTVSWWITRQIRALANTATAIAKGEAGVPPPARLREIAEINRALDRAAEANVERKQAEHLNALLASVVASSPDAMFSTDRNRVFRTWNEGAEKLYGHSALEAVGQTLDLIAAQGTADERKRLWSRAMQGKRTRLETVRRRKDGSLVEVEISNAPIFNKEGHFEGVCAVHRDITERRRAEEHLRFTMRELSHRSKNLLAVVQAMARQTARQASDFDDFESRFAGRMQALAHCHDLLVKSEWRGGAVADLIRLQLAPFAEVGQRVRAEGPSVALVPEAMQTLGLALHELATNAVKHGALSVPAGSVLISWEYGREGRELRFTWQEAGGPPVEPPRHRGFGHAVLERMAKTLEGDVSLSFEPSGFVWRVTIGAEKIALSERASAAPHAAMELIAERSLAPARLTSPRSADHRA